MTSTMAIGLALQGASLVAMFMVLRGTWLKHLGAIFIVFAVTFHGLGQLLHMLFPLDNRFRYMLTNAEVDDFCAWVSITIVILTTVYLTVVMTARRRPAGPAPKVDMNATSASLQRAFPLWLLLLLTAPLVLWTIQGQGLTASSGYLGADTRTRMTVTSGLAAQFLVLLLPLVAMAWVLKFGRRWIVPTIIVEAMVLSLAGQRNEVVVAVVLTAYVMARIGVRWSRRQIAATLLSVAAVALIMTSTRAIAGRDSFNAGGDLAGRIDATRQGVLGVTSQKTLHQVRFTVAQRLDGNSFGAFELAKINKGEPPLGLTPVRNNILLAVPSAVNPTKLNTSLTERSEKLYAETQLGMPVTDMLVTQLGGTVGYYGVESLLVASLLLGLFLAALDLWLATVSAPASRTTAIAIVSPQRLLIGVGALNALAHYGRGLESWTVTARGVLLLVLALAVLKLIEGMTRSVLRSLNPQVTPKLQAPARTP